MMGILEFFVRLYIRKQRKYMHPRQISEYLLYLSVDEDLRKLNRERNKV